MVQIYKNEAVIFDLDDLLYKEFDFVRSAFWFIARSIAKREAKNLFRLMMVHYFSGNAVLDWLYADYLKGQGLYTRDSLLEMYRNHKPDISLNSDVFVLLSKLKENGNFIGLVTDGRSVSQRNKIEALGLNNWFDDFSISEESGYEKPSDVPFLYFMERFKVGGFVYLADNYNKDFIAPNRLGWRTIALLDNGLNIHSIKENLDPGNIPGEVISSIREIEVSSACIANLVI
jgi:putative hydrolase of the HAD superfamily